MNYIDKIISNLRSTYLVSKDVKVKKKKRKIIYSVALKNIVALIEILIFICLSYLITSDIAENRVNEYLDIKQISKFLPLIIALRVGLNYLDYINAEMLGIHTKQSIKKENTKKLFSFPNLSFEYVNYKVHNQSGSISHIYKIFITIIGVSLQLLTFLVTVVFLNLEVAALLFLFFIILFFPVKKLLITFKNLAFENTEYSLEIDRNLERIISNFYLIKILKKENLEIDRFENSLDKSINLEKKTTKLIFVKYHLFNTLVTLLVSMALIQTFFEINLTLELLFILVRGVQFYGQISNQYAMLLERKHFINNYLKEMNTNVIERHGSVVHGNDNENSIIQIESVDFCFDDSEDYIFKNLNLSIKENTHNLILGPNGSGKSTLIGLITGFHIPNLGSIKVGSEKFGYVGPVPLIFTDSLENNLTYGTEDKEINNDKLLNYLDKLKVFEKIDNETLEMIVSTKVLSSGQMQKLSFIRAFLRNPDILFLDEAISNIDKNSIELILNEIDKFQGTVINITHNPETFKNVDNIFRIEDNKLNELKLL